MTSVGKPKSFRIAFPDKDLARLQARLDDTQLPDDEIVPDATWAYGTNLAKLRQLVDDWRKGSPCGADGKPVSPPNGVTSWWRSVETRLNK